jgi:glc operon protein GlcG
MEKITLTTAEILVAAGARAAAEDYGRSICIAVTDSHGDLIAFARQDGAPCRSIAIATGKAYSAARLGVDTYAFHQRLQRENLQASDFCDPRITGMPGGAAIKNAAGVLIGAVGVSGLKPDEDQAVASKVAARATTAL